MINWALICDQIHLVTSRVVEPINITPVSGGCINQCYLLGDQSHHIFVKTNHQNQLFMFEAEAAGLAALTKARAIQVPEVYTTGVSGNTAFIAMQAVEFGSPQPKSYTLFAEQLASLHRYKAQSFGADCNNTIGASPQNNAQTENWFDFWRIHRLGAMLEMARERDANARLIDDGYQLSEKMETLFNTAPTASCLHGDLWQGNWAFDHAGQPLIFDPAHYFGDREADLAMMALFGQPPAEFYTAYEAIYPLRPNYARRKTFYNIYHILNHFVLFGGGYEQQAHHMIQSVLSEIR